MNKWMYDDRMEVTIPAEVLNAAVLVSNYAKKEGFVRWAIGPVCDRTHFEHEVALLGQMLKQAQSELSSLSSSKHVLERPEPSIEDLMSKLEDFRKTTQSYAEEITSLKSQLDQAQRENLQLRSTLLAYKGQTE
jgi:peptidoglycan hydrolase CwlO-like protein